MGFDGWGVAFDWRSRTIIGRNFHQIPHSGRLGMESACIWYNQNMHVTRTGVSTSKFGSIMIS